VAAKEPPTFQRVVLVGFLLKPNRYKPHRGLKSIWLTHLYLWQDEPFLNGRLSNLLFVDRTGALQRTIHPASKFLIVTVPLYWDEYQEYLYLV